MYHESGKVKAIITVELNTDYIYERIPSDVIADDALSADECVIECWVPCIRTVHNDERHPIADFDNPNYSDIWYAVEQDKLQRDIEEHNPNCYVSVDFTDTYRWEG